MTVRPPMCNGVDRLRRRPRGRRKPLSDEACRVSAAISCGVSFSDMSIVRKFKSRQHLPDPRKMCPQAVGVEFRI